MNLYMTSGTKNFLLPLMEKFSNENIVLMQNSQNTLLVHETESKKVSFNNQNLITSMIQLETFIEVNLLLFNISP